MAIDTGYDTEETPYDPNFDDVSLETNPGYIEPSAQGGTGGLLGKAQELANKGVTSCPTCGSPIGTGGPTPPTASAPTNMGGAFGQLGEGIANAVPSGDGFQYDKIG